MIYLRMEQLSCFLAEGLAVGDLFGDGAALLVLAEELVDDDLLDDGAALLVFSRGPGRW